MFQTTHSRTHHLNFLTIPSNRSHYYQHFQRSIAFTGRLRTLINHLSLILTRRNQTLTFWILLSIYAQITPLQSMCDRSLRFKLESGDRMCKSRGFTMDQNEMCWLPSPIAGEGLILYLKPSGRMWRPYNTYREFAVPDYPIPGGSKGWATYQKLTRSHWVLLPTPRDAEGNAVMPGSVSNG